MLSRGAVPGSSTTRVAPPDCLEKGLWIALATEAMHSVKLSYETRVTTVNGSRVGHAADSL